MVHRIHEFGSSYVVNGESFGSASPNAGYPGLVQNCQACHVESNGAAKNAANWRTMPTKAACGSCHDSAFANAHFSANISGGVQTCTICHGPGKVADVKLVHAQ
jgi:OmcA/MtrC family decaheme c-type cytochrome